MTINIDPLRTGMLIKKFRKEKNLTQIELGNLCNMADSAIRRYESGRVMPKLEALSKIAKALNVSVSDFLEPDLLKITDDMIGLFSDSSLQEITLTPEEKALQSTLNFAFQKLNLTGKRKLADYAQDLTEIERYKAPADQPDQPEAPDNPPDHD